MNHVWSDRGQLADCGKYQWSTGSGDTSRTHSWNFAAFRLPRPMPHLLLNAKANNLRGMALLPIDLDKGQRLTLGAPFDDHYALHAPQGYGHDAFYLFPPDLMAMLIDAPGAFDIEIVDQWMFVYTPSEMDLARPSTWQLIGHIEATIGARIAQQAGRYADLRTADYE